MEKIKAFWSTITRPAYLVAYVGLIGFGLDYLWKPISNAGLILLGFVVAPFVLRLVRRVSFSGVDLDLIPQATEEEQKEKLDEESKDSVDLIQATEGSEATSVQTASIEDIRSRYFADEALMIREISARTPGNIRREVRLGDRVVDAVITSKYQTEVVEFKVFYKKFLTLENLRRIVTQVVAARDFLQDRSPMVPIKARLVVGVDTCEGELLDKTRERVATMRQSRPDIKIDVMLLPELRKKWGVGRP